MTTPRNIAIVPTGVANMASIEAAFRRAGIEPQIVQHATDIEACDALVLPGVGAFASAMRELEAQSWLVALRTSIQAGRPLLAICLGMQLLAESSEESPGSRGLGIVNDRAASLPSNVRVPHMGWNLITPDPDCALLMQGHAYFANSFGYQRAPEGWSVAWTEHGTSFVSAMERGSQLACQFHPELSGQYGTALIERWLARIAQEATQPC